MTKCKISSDSKSLFYQARSSNTCVPWPGQQEMAAHLNTWACGTFRRPWPGWWVPPSVSASRWRAWVPCEWTWPGRSRAPESERRNCCPSHRHRRWCWPAPQGGGGWNPVQQALLASRWVSKALALQSVWYWAMAVSSLYLFTSLWYWAMAVSSLYLFTTVWYKVLAVNSLYLFTSVWYSHSCKWPVPIYHLLNSLYLFTSVWYMVMDANSLYLFTVWYKVMDTSSLYQLTTVVCIEFWQICICREYVSA